MKNMDLYQNLMKNFAAVGCTEPVAPTFMEISGYPHFENVCSNILSFFLTPEECHRMGDILLTSLFLTLGYDSEALHFQNVAVEREAGTDLKQRIDLVIETDTFLIGIENKIFSGVYNDLKHYSDYLRRRASKDKEVVPVLLTLRPQSGMDSSQLFSFRCVTYSQLFSTMQTLIGQYAIDCDQRYLIYLLDFMKTIDRLGRGFEMNKDMLEFLKENGDSVCKLLSDLKAVRIEFRREIGQLRNAVLFDESTGIRQWLYTPSEYMDAALVHEIPTLGDRKLALDAFISPTGWTIFIHTRNKGTLDLQEWLATREIQCTRTVSDTKLVYADYDYDADKVMIGSVVTELLGKLT